MAVAMFAHGALPEPNLFDEVKGAAALAALEHRVQGKLRIRSALVPEAAPDFSACGSEKHFGDESAQLAAKTQAAENAVAHVVATDVAEAEQSSALVAQLEAPQAANEASKDHSVTGKDNLSAAAGVAETVGVSARHFVSMPSSPTTAWAASMASNALVAQLEAPQAANDALKDHSVTGADNLSAAAGVSETVGVSARQFVSMPSSPTTAWVASMAKLEASVALASQALEQRPSSGYDPPQPGSERRLTPLRQRLEVLLREASSLQALLDDSTASRISCRRQTLELEAQLRAGASPMPVAQIPQLTSVKLVQGASAKLRNAVEERDAMRERVLAEERRRTRAEADAVALRNNLSEDLATLEARDAEVAATFNLWHSCSLEAEALRQQHRALAKSLSEQRTQLATTRQSIEELRAADSSFAVASDSGMTKHRCSSKPHAIPPVERATPSRVPKPKVTARSQELITPSVFGKGSRSPSPAQQRILWARKATAQALEELHAAEQAVSLSAASGESSSSNVNCHVLGAVHAARVKAATDHIATLTGGAAAAGGSLTTKRLVKPEMPAKELEPHDQDDGVVADAAQLPS